MCNMARKFGENVNVHVDRICRLKKHICNFIIVFLDIKGDLVKSNGILEQFFRPFRNADISCVPRWWAPPAEG